MFKCHRKPMDTRAIFPLLGFVSLALMLPAQTVSSHGPCENQPLFSRVSVEPQDEKQAIKSPGGQNSITIATIEDQKDPDGLYTLLTVNHSGKRHSAKLTGFRSEALWAADSSSFIINQTEGGGGFGQRAYLFQITSASVRKIDLSVPIERVFGFPGRCEFRVLPQTAALGWLAPDRMLITAEVVDVSVCRYRGTFKTYELSLPGLHIVKSHTQLESKRLFPQLLGCELRNADDRLAARWQK